MRTLLRRLRPHVRNLSVLTIGTVVAQLVPIIASPILSRLYSPADFGVWAVFVSLASILAATASAKYSAAVYLPDTLPETVHIARLSIYVSLSNCILAAAAAALLLLLWPESALTTSLGAMLLMVPIVSLAGSISETLSNFGIKEGKYAPAAWAGATRASATSASQVAMGLTGFGALGLQFGSCVGAVAQLPGLIRHYVAAGRSVPRSARAVVAAARRYNRFPKYEWAASLVYALMLTAVPLGLALLYSDDTVGQYALSMRTVSIPSALIGVSIGQLFYREIARRRDRPLVVRGLMDRLVIALAAASIVPFGIISLRGAELFIWVFGERWEQAGDFARAAMLYVWPQFIASPITTVFLVYARGRTRLVLQCGTLLLGGACFGASFVMGLSAYQLVLAYSACGGIMSLVTLALARRAIPTDSRSAGPSSAHTDDTIGDDPGAMR